MWKGRGGEEEERGDGAFQGDVQEPGHQRRHDLSRAAAGRRPDDAAGGGPSAEAGSGSGPGLIPLDMF